MSAAAFRASVALAGSPNLPLIERLADEFRSIFGEDEADEFMEALDAETDVLDVTGALLEQLNEAEAAETGSRAEAEKFEARAKRMKDRQANIKRVLGSILDATGEQKIKHPLATVSRTKGMKSVQITDPASVPTQLCVVTRTPDKQAIRKQIEAGEDVPGAELRQGEPGVAVRR